MDITLIAIAIFIFVAIAFLGLYMFKSINKKSFITKLSSEGFSDLKTLVKFRKQFQSLSDLINT